MQQRCHNFVASSLAIGNPQVQPPIANGFLNQADSVSPGSVKLSVMTHFIAALNSIRTLLLQCLKHQAAAIRADQVCVELNWAIIGGAQRCGYMLGHI